MQINLLSSFDSNVYRCHDIKKSERVIAIVSDPIYYDGFIREMKEFERRNKKLIEAGKEPRKLEVSIRVDYRSRSLSQNAWLWSAHTLEANFLNGNRSAWTDAQGIKWRTSESITPEMVHFDYMERYAARGTIDVDAAMVPALSRMLEADTGHVMERQGLPDGRVRLEVWKTSSYLTVREFCELARHVEAQMLAYGVTFREAYEFLSLTADLKRFEEKALKEEKDAKPREWANLSDEEKQANDRYRYWEEKGAPIV